SITR
ncbi:4-hydroxybenzoate polyprenyltransferase domain protein, partial [Chlamydia psittaci 84-8471/1]